MAVFPWITAFVSWHPSAPEMLVMRRARGRATVPAHRSDGQTAPAHPAVAIRCAMRCSSRGAGDYILFTRDSAGDEATQLYRLDPKTLAETLLTRLASSISPGPWNSAQDKMIVTSRPLDRNGRRAQAVVDVCALIRCSRRRASSWQRSPAPAGGAALAGP